MVKEFNLHWSIETYGVYDDIRVNDMSYFSEDKGFAEEDKQEIDNLEVNESYREKCLFGKNGLIVTRIR